MAVRKTRKSSYFKGRRKNRIWSLIIGLLVLLSLFAFAQGKVIKVTDGDSLTVLTAEGKFASVRLYGIDCPEFRQAGGPEATALTNDLAFLKEVKITVIDVDQYGRSVALVHLPDGRILNQELVAAGHAWVYTNYCKESFCTGWKLLEQKARAEKKGLWAKPNPKAPWNWRKENRGDLAH